nr:putative ribonuclease H-like domain-containing protein [Tanacetum cinerariifolium]
PLPDPSMVILSIPRKYNLYTFSLNELSPKGALTCLIAKASHNETTLWHKRLGPINFKNMNKLVKGNLVRGLPSKVFQNNHTCVACNKGKQHKASYKAIPSISIITKPLHLLHMDLFGRTSVRSINNKYYCLVITDEYTRFNWVYFLEHKSETFLILKIFITLVENQFNHKVKAIRCNNGTEFKNANLIEFCGSKGIRQDYSNDRTPQQNRVAERKNQTLIEATRTMLAYSLLPTIFWTEVVATACYVLNRVLVTKPHDKTPYELLTGDKPSISYLKPFGCHVTILNTSDPLGKFDKKLDEGYIVGTPPVSAGSTPPMSPCASPISVDRHSISAGKSHVSAGRPIGSAGRPVSAGRPSGSAARTPVLAGRILGKFTVSVSSERFPRASSVETLDIHDGLKIFDCLKSDVSSTITKRIHNIHPTSEVLGDINSPVQTRSQVKHKGSS